MVEHSFLLRKPYLFFGNRYALVQTPSEEDNGKAGTLTLQLKREVRFRQSALVDLPAGPKDTLGTRDHNGRPFLEPTMCFHSMIEPAGGFFGVCQTPAVNAGGSRWQFSIRL